MVLALAAPHATLMPGETRTIRCQLMRGDVVQRNLDFVPSDASFVHNIVAPAALYHADADQLRDVHDITLGTS